MAGGSRRRRRQTGKLVVLSEVEKVQWLRTKLDEASAELHGSPYWAAIRTIVDQWLVLNPGRKVRCNCFGLGSFESSAPARYQLVLAAALFKILPLRESHVALIHDPVMTKVDTLAAVHCFDADQLLNIAAAEMPKSCMVSDSDLTLCVMPHCTRAMYSDLLEAHWDRGQLSCLAVLGNSFSLYEVRYCDEEKWSFVEKCIAFIDETPCPAPFQLLYSAYNDQSLHHFLSPRLPAAAEEFWKWTLSSTVRESLNDHYVEQV